MTCVPTDLSPAQLMGLRFNAQSKEDYAAIYHSSHRLSTLRRSFLSLKEYIKFASEQLSGQITITDYEILVEQLFGKKAYVLCRVTMAVQGQTEEFIEVAELQRSVMGWRFLHCARLPIDLLPEDPSSSNLKQFSTHPAAVVY